MQTIRMTLADLFGFDDDDSTSRQRDEAAITSYALEHFSFLPQPLTVSVQGDDAVLEFPERPKEARTEAARLAAKAAKRAAAGDYEKAIGTLTRALQLDPSLHTARRDLAMAYVGQGDSQKASKHLVEVLRLNPKDAEGWVALGNLYAREEGRPDLGERFLRRALDCDSDNASALGSLAWVLHERDELDEALRLFDQAIQADPWLPDLHVDKAIVLRDSNQAQAALDVLGDLFAHTSSLGTSSEARSTTAHVRAGRIYRELQEQLACEQHPDAVKCVQGFGAEVAALSGLPMQAEEGEAESTVGVQLQIAWRYGRDHHVMMTARGLGPEMACHLQAHEVAHLKMESVARTQGKNLLFTTTADTMEIAIGSLASDMFSLKEAGYPEESVAQAMVAMVSCLCGLLYHCPLDMIIERAIRDDFPVLRPAQFLSLGAMAGEAAATNSTRDVVKLTPRRILDATLALNGAYALFLDDLFGGATNFADQYRRGKPFALAQRLYDRWRSQSESLQPGDEYRLVDEFADMLSLHDWYEWQPGNPGGEAVGSQGGQ